MNKDITYNEMTQDGRVIVKLEGRTVGHIKPVDAGFIYIPKGQSLKRVLEATQPVSLSLVKARLEAR